MPRKLDESRILFDRWAHTYDRSLAVDGPRLGPLAGYAESLRMAAELLPLEPGASVLDIGIGTGAFAALLQERGGQISGVDPSQKMLDQCLAQHPDYRLAVGSFDQIPFADGSFDVAVSSFAFHEVEPGRRLEAMREVARVVRPGGLVALLDLVFASAEAREEARAEIGPLWDDEEEYPLVEEVDRWARAAGLAQTVWRQTAPCHWIFMAVRI